MAVHKTKQTARIDIKNLILCGISGHVAGEERFLEADSSVTIGRSRSADISLRQMPNWMRLSPRDRQMDEDFLSVAATHLRVHIHADYAITIENFSRDGSVINGERILRDIHLPAPFTTNYLIEFGLLERMEIRMNR